MLGYAIRIVDERGDSFYKDSSNLKNSFLVGELLETAKFFSSMGRAEGKMACLDKYMKTMMGDRTIFDHILETNSKFTGFEIVPVEFDELFFTLSLNVEDKIVHIRSIQHDLEDGHPYVCLSQVHADAERYFSYQDATTAVKILKQQNFLLHEHIHVEEVFVNPKLSK